MPPGIATVIFAAAPCGLGVTRRVADGVAATRARVAGRVSRSGPGGNPLDRNILAGLMAVSVLVLRGIGNTI